jgi:arginine repressor
MRWQDMKTNRQSKIIEIIQKNEVETQDELSALLEKDGFRVTQATVSRDIRELKLTKIPTASGRQKYAVITDAPENLSKKYERVLREGFLSMDMAQNILVIKTVSGMASAVCAAIDAMKMREIVGSIAGDDTIMCAIRTVDDTYAVMTHIRRIEAVSYMNIRL